MNIKRSVTLMCVCLLVGVLFVACDSSDEASDAQKTKVAASIFATQTADAPTKAPDSAVTGIPSVTKGTDAPTSTATVVTPTLAPSATPSPSPVQAPTDTPMIMCTPPACGADEVYYCPGDCPGGCGTECATRTPPPPGAPRILSFTADRTHIVEGEEVTLSWQAEGGDEAFIEWVAPNAILVGAPGPLNPDGGTVTISPTGQGDIRLFVRNSAGAVEAYVHLFIECAHEWMPALEKSGYPLPAACPWEADVGQAAQQPFERGFMMWLAPRNAIYVFYENGSYRVYPDEFQEGDPERDPDLVPPEGLEQPIRGFGLVWRTQPEVREGLGWATASEMGFSTWIQGYQGSGMHSVFEFVQDIEGPIYRLTAFSSTWEIVVP